MSYCGFYCMKILSIETSCDETAVSLLDCTGTFAGRTGGSDFSFRVLGNALNSQAALHAQYGGVFPNLAKREHAKNLVPLLEACLQQAGELAMTVSPTAGTMLMPLKQLLEREPELFQAIIPFLIRHEKPQIDAIAVTHGPGLEPALWVGINFAKALSAAWDVPLVAVNHMEGHVVMSLVQHSNILENVRMSGTMRAMEFPLLALLISGGHTELVVSESFGTYRRIGETRDDAAGEAFDKTARLMGLPYPGGPEISRLAAAARAEGLEPLQKLTPPMLKSPDYDFSFSGLKTEVRKLIEKNAPLTAEAQKRISLAVENSIAEVLVAKAMRAVEEFGIRSLAVGGGVSANAYIRQRLGVALHESDASATLLVPDPALATDNAIMIGLAGYFQAQRGEYSRPSDIVATGNLKLND